MIDSAKLYQLSQATGTSLDLEQNCERFIKEVIALKELSHASVWLSHRLLVGEDHPLGEAAEESAVRVYQRPPDRRRNVSISLSHPIYRMLGERGTVSLTLPDRAAEDILSPSMARTGKAAVFSLEKLGFMVLYAAERRSRFSRTELRDLEQVVTKFAGSLEGCITHLRLTREVTRRKRLEVELRHRQEHTRALIENALDVIFVLQYDTSIRFASPSVLRVLGREVDSVQKRSLLELVHPDEVPRMMSLFKGELMRPGIGPSFDLRLLHADGGWRIFETETNNLLSLQSVAGIIIHCHDVTDSRHYRNALRVSEERFALAVTGSHDAIWDWDLVNDRIYFSQRWTEIIGAEEACDTPSAWFESILEEDRAGLRSAIHRHLGGDADHIEHEYRVHRPDGKEVWVLCRGVAVRDEEGRPLRLAGSQTDVSEAKRQQKALDEARLEALASSRARGEFLANMSHEIRTPMNGIIGMASLVLDTGLTPQQREFVQTIMVSGQALLSIVNDVLDFSKIESGKLELDKAPFSPQRCIEDSVDTVAAALERRDIELQCRIEEAVPQVVLGDMVKTRQILINLLSNAVKFTEQGEIVVAVQQTATAGSGNEPIQLMFSVRDTGIGIPPANLRTVFEPFRQADSSTARRFGGTGLGLTICQRLCHAMGGQIWVESTVGKGTTFSFTIEVETAAEEAEVPADRREDLSGRRILVGHQNPTALGIIADHIRSWGGEPIQAVSGSAVRQVLRAADPLDAGVLAFPARTIRRCLARANKLNHRRALPFVLLKPLGLSPEQESQWPQGPLIRSLTKPAREASLRQALAALVVGSEDGVEPIADADALEAAAPRPLSILLAEDNPVNRKVTMLMLERLGYQPDVVENGNEVLDAISKNEYDVILMDVQMPQMDGIEATQHIRRGRSSSRPHIVALTAHAMHGDRERFLEAGMNDFVSKPVQVHELRAVLERVPEPGEPEPVDQGPPVLDTQLLRGIASFARPGFLGAVFDEFLASAGEQLATLRRAFTEQDFQVMEGAAHHLLGSCLSLGAERMAAACRLLQAGAQERDLAQTERQLAAVEEQFAKVQPILEEQRRADEGPAPTSNAAVRE